MMLPVLAVDPGVVGGAAVLLSPGRLLLAALAWRSKVSTDPLVARWWTASGREGRLPGVGSAYRLGVVLDRVLRLEAPDGYLLVVEDAFVGRSAGVSLNGARWAGACAGPLEPGARGPVEWVKAAVWRYDLLRIPVRTKRDEAKRRTLAGLPDEMRDTLATIGPLVGGPQHLADAAGLALWRLGERFTGDDDDHAAASRAPRRRPRRA